jgi:predicted nicotinamide N-methyase
MTIPGATLARAGFVRAHTRLAPLRWVSEIRLHQADDVITLWERTEAELGTALPPPFWAFGWAGGLALARYVLDHPRVVRGRTVFDLASGSGLVAIAAARAGASAVAGSDLDPLAVAAIDLNARANGVRVAAAVTDVLGDETVDGDAGGGRRHGHEPRGGAGQGRDPAGGAGQGRDPAGGAGQGRDPAGGAGQGRGPGGGAGQVRRLAATAEVVLAGDVFYSRPMAERVLPYLRRCRDRGAAVLIGDPHRAYLPRDGLRVVAAYDVPVPRALEDRDVKRTTVWELAEND